MRGNFLAFSMKFDYVEIVQFVKLLRPYFDDFLPVYKECRLKFVVLSLRNNLTQLMSMSILCRFQIIHV